MTCFSLFFNKNQGYRKAVDDEAQSKCSELTLEYPIYEGIVADWDGMEAVSKAETVFTSKHEGRYHAGR